MLKTVVASSGAGSFLLLGLRKPAQVKPTLLSTVSKTNAIYIIFLSLLSVCVSVIMRTVAACIFYHITTLQFLINISLTGLQVDNCAVKVISHHFTVNMSMSAPT